MRSLPRKSIQLKYCEKMYYQCFHFPFGGLHIIGRWILGNLNNRGVRRCFRLCRGRVDVRISITCQGFRFYRVFFVVILRNLRVFWVLGGFCFLVIFVGKLKGISDGQCKSLSLKRRRKVQKLTSFLKLSIPKNLQNRKCNTLPWISYFFGYWSENIFFASDLK